MKAVEKYIEAKQNRLKEHPFFSRLDELDSMESVINIAPDMAFWVMTFQDILRLNEPRVKDPYLFKVARHHRLEDAGHQKWFLKDIGYDKEKLCGVRKLFDQQDTLIRDEAYALVSEVFNTDDDHLRVALLLTLESAGHIFFGHMAELSVRSGAESRLQYFSKSHMDVEEAHSMFEEEMEKKVFEAKLSPARQRAAKEMIDRCYAAFTSMFDELLVKLNQDIAQETETLSKVS